MHAFDLASLNESSSTPTKADGSASYRELNHSIPNALEWTGGQFRG